MYKVKRWGQAYYFHKSCSQLGPVISKQLTANKLEKTFALFSNQASLDFSPFYLKPNRSHDPNCTKNCLECNCCSQRDSRTFSVRPLSGSLDVNQPSITMYPFTVFSKRNAGYLAVSLLGLILLLKPHDMYTPSSFVLH